MALITSIMYLTLSRNSCLNSLIARANSSFLGSYVFELRPPIFYVCKLDCKPLYLLFQFFDPLFVLAFGHSWVDLPFFLVMTVYPFSLKERSQFARMPVFVSPKSRETCLSASPPSRTLSMAASLKSAVYFC